MFYTGSMTKNRKIKNIADGIMQVHKLYLKCGFNIRHMHADRKFEPILKEMNALDIQLNCESKKEHAPGIKRFIWTVKERIKSARDTMSFK